MIIGWTAAHFFVITEVRQATNIPCIEQNTEGRAPSDPRTLIFRAALELIHLAGLHLEQSAVSC